MPYFEAGIDIPKELPYQKKKAAPKLKMMIGSVGSRRGSNADHSHDNASIGKSNSKFKISPLDGIWLQVS